MVSISLANGNWTGHSLDSRWLEVTIVGSIASRLTEQGSGLALDASQIGTAAAFYVAGACTAANLPILTDEWRVIQWRLVWAVGFEPVTFDLSTLS